MPNRDDLDALRMEMRGGFTSVRAILATQAATDAELRASVAEVRAGLAGVREDLAGLHGTVREMFDFLTALRREYQEQTHE